MLHIATTESTECTEGLGSFIRGCGVNLTGVSPRFLVTRLTQGSSIFLPPAATLITRRRCPIPRLSDPAGSVCLGGGGQQVLVPAPENQSRDYCQFTIRLRCPGWLGTPLASDLYRYADNNPEGIEVKFNGAVVEPGVENGYWVINRSWTAGDTIKLELPMPARRVICSDKIEQNRGRVAVERGPLVYCIEGADHGGKVLDMILGDDVVLTPETREDLLGGIVTLTGKARRGNAAKAAGITMIPYFAWCRRGANEMAVWLPRESAGAKVQTR